MEQSRVTLFVPGVTASSWGDDDVPDDVELEWIRNDGGFGTAFGFGTVDDVLVAAIDASAGAVLAHVGVDLREGRAEVVALVARLQAAGGLAVRLEESGLGWEIGQWLAAYAGDDPWAWHHHAVLFVSDDDGAVQSCGMSAFSLPDVRLAPDDRDALRVAKVLDVYQVEEDPVIRSGETFTPDAETPRRPLQRWPDTMRPSHDPCHNPYGVWHLGSPGAPGAGPRELDLTFVPPLRAILAAAELQGRRLDESQVLAIRDDAACIAMEPRHARDLERSRGYADIDPELAWEQWQLVRDA